MPCPYIPPAESRPNSLASVPDLSHSSTISTSTFSTGLVSTFQQHITYKEEDVVQIMTICAFHAEDWEENYRMKHGLEDGNAGARTARLKKRQREKKKRNWEEKEAKMGGVPLGVWSLADPNWASWYDDSRSRY
jgi:hypothetical protein